jgi:hypothetical protein
MILHTGLWNQDITFNESLWGRRSWTMQSLRRPGRHKHWLYLCCIVGAISSRRRGVDMTSKWIGGIVSDEWIISAGWDVSECSNLCIATLRGRVFMRECGKLIVVNWRIVCHFEVLGLTPPKIQYWVASICSIDVSHDVYWLRTHSAINVDVSHCRSSQRTTRGVVLSRGEKGYVCGSNSGDAIQTMVIGWAGSVITRVCLLIGVGNDGHPLRLEQ